jgi:hypothetical protein
MQVLIENWDTYEYADKKYLEFKIPDIHCRVYKIPPLSLTLNSLINYQTSHLFLAYTPYNETRTSWKN